MSDSQKPPTPLPETPWEFYPDDDIRAEPAVGPEDAAMHIDQGLPFATGDAPDGPEETVHYFEDEEPEVPDASEPAPDQEHTPDVEDLLIRQHYLPTSESEDEQ